MPSTALKYVTVQFQNLWVGQFWPPGFVQGDLAFKFDEFTSLLKHYDITFRPVLPHRDHKNLMEPKHGVMRSILYGYYLLLLRKTKIFLLSLLCTYQMRCMELIGCLHLKFQNGI